MRKLLIIPSKKEHFELDGAGFVLGIKGLSINMPNVWELSDLVEIKDKEIFIMLNKNMHSGDLGSLEKTLLELNEYSIKAVIFYDLALPNLAKKLKLNYDLVWGQEHLTTNYAASEFWYEQGIKYTMLSNNITLDEIKEFRGKTKAKLLLQVFGYVPIFTSKRDLVANYLDHYQVSAKASGYYIKKEDELYPVTTEEGITTIYSSYVLNGLREVIDLDVDYLILNSFLIEEIGEVLNLFKTVNKENIGLYEQKLVSKFNNLATGFLFKETIFKVKKND